MSKRRPTTLQTRFGFAKLCARCRVAERLEWHHVTYQPEKVVPLCHWCHLRITKRNGKAAWKLGHPLNNNERQAIWQLFMRRSK